jgi:putative ABC transport system permease protein
MSWLQRLWRRWRLLVHRDAAERSMNEELWHHIESEIAERIRNGMSPADARRTALSDFGSIDAVKEDARDARGLRWVDDLTLDVRYAVRVLAHDRSFTLAALTTFALGVGAVTAIVSLVYGILLRPLPYPAPGRLVTLWERNLPRDVDRNVVSLDNYEAWRDRAHSFVRMGAIVPTSATLTTGPVPERVVGADITPGYFGVLGVRPAIGRDFLAADALDGACVILSAALWQTRFGGDPGIVGRTIALSGKPFTVVGVMPADFEPPRFGWLGDQELWFPFVATEQSRSWGRFLLVVARLHEGVTMERARAEMVSIARQRAAESPANRGWSTTMAPLAQQITGEVQTPLLVLLVAVALLLTMAVANVATLTLSVMSHRGQELALRRAIGATDGRLFRQLFAQSALLGMTGAVVGALVAIRGVAVLVASLPPDVPRAASVTVDAPVLLLTAAVSVVATMLFGTVAAARGRRAGAESRLSRDAAGARITRGAGGGWLIAIELALAVALSVMAMLMVRSFAGLRAVDLGFAPQGVVIARVALPAAAYPTAMSQRVFFDRLIERVRGLPGVRSAGLISGRPLGGFGAATTVRDAASAPPVDLEDPVAEIRYVDRGAFAALGIPLERGALFDDGDAADRPPSVVISASLARTLWGKQDAVGRELSMQLYGGIVARVIGVVGDIHSNDVRSPPRPTAYLSASRFPMDSQDLVARAEGPPEALVTALRTVARSLDPSLPLYDIVTMPALVSRSLARDWFIVLLLAGFAGIALLLAAVGIVGVFAGDVTRRRKEIAIRLALGARESRVVSMLLVAATRRATAGIAAGVLLAGVMGHVMQSLLFGVGPTDPVSFAGVAALVMAVALAATLVPTWQALRARPLTSLREE